MRRSLPVISGIALLVLGAALIVVPYPFAPTAPSVASSTPATRPAAAASAAASAAATRDPRTPISDGYRVQIPRLHIDLPISEGDIVRDTEQFATPESFAFHLPGTSIPGLGSNTYLYAHARVGMFLTLWDAKPGDEIFISTPDLKALKYVVAEVHPRVPRTDTSWIQPTPAERVTLQTSTGPNPEDPRFVVVAVPAG